MFVAWPGDRRLRGRLDRGEARRGVVVGDHEQARGDREADQRADVDVDPAGRVAAAAGVRQVIHHPRRHGQDQQRGEHAGEDQALVERPLDVAGRRLDRERADDRGDDRHAAEHEREQDDRALRVAAERQHAQQHHGDRGDRVGLEQVRGHAGAVADVVADVVGDHGRVARVVLGDARLDLAHDVGADVGALREDAAAQAGEHRDQRAAEAEADQRVHGVLLVDVEEERQHAVVAGDAEQREPDHEHPGDGAAAERDVERRADAAAGGFGDAGVGPHRDVHADEAGGRGGEATDQEADRDLDVLQRDQGDEEHGADDRDRRVLAAQVGGSTLLDRGREAAHDLVAGRQGQERAARDQAVPDGGQRADQRDDDPVVGQEFGQGKPLRSVQATTKAAAEVGPPPERSGSLSGAQADAVDHCPGIQRRPELCAAPGPSGSAGSAGAWAPCSRGSAAVPPACWA